MSTAQHFTLMTGGDLSAAVESDPILAIRRQGFSAQCATVGSAVGTLQLQVSNDEGSIPEAGEQEATGLSKWVTIATLAVSGSGTYDINYNNKHFYRWARVRYEPTSGSGTMDIQVSGKVDT